MPYSPEDKSNYQRNYSRNKNLEDCRDVGKPPDCVNPERRESCRLDFLRYLTTYHEAAFPLEFSKDHLRLIQSTQEVILNSGCVLAVFPRGSGKTTIFQRAEIWASLYGHRRFPMLLCADDGKFKNLLKGVKTILENNELLFEDFPEVIHPIRKLERIPLRANSQICEGQPTYMRWSTEQLVFPTTKYSKEAGNAGVIIAGGGLTGAAVRGGVVTTPGGEQVRPDCVLIDDPQTRKSAKSVSQCQEREDIVNGDVMGMAGPNKPIALLCAATQIYQDDLVGRLLDRERSPNWNGIKVSMITKWPKNMAIWDKYDTVRRQELLDELDDGAANEFYKKHRDELELGGEVYWPSRCNPGKLSALQSAMDQYYTNPRTFMAEFQNEPESTAEGDLEELSSIKLAKRTTQQGVGVVPAECSKITAHIDVQSKLLYWMVVAWTESLGGSIIEYGTTPKVNRSSFNLNSVRKGMAEHYKLDDDAALKAAIKDTTEYISGKVYRRVDGAEMSLDRGLIDSRYKTEVVEAGLQLSEARNWMPCYGVGIGAKDAPISSWTKKRGGRRGVHMVIYKPPTRLYVSMFLDVNYWKSQAYLGLSVPLTHNEAITFYKSPSSKHAMACDHFCAETATRVEAKGRIVDEWSLPSNKPDNHFWDNLVGCMGAASLCGIRKETQREPVRRKQRRPAKRVSKLKI